MTHSPPFHSDWLTALIHSTPVTSLMILVQWGSWVQVLVLPVFSNHWSIVIVQSPSHIWLFVTPWTAAHQASLSPTIFWSLPKFTFIELVMPANHLILCPPSSPYVFNLFQHRYLFQLVTGLQKVAKVLELQHQSFQWIFRVISFKIDLFDLLAVQGTLKSLLQHHNWKTSVVRRSAFFMVKLSLLCLTNGKTIALTIRTFVGKVMSLLFKTLSRFVITFVGYLKFFFSYFGNSYKRGRLVGLVTVRSSAIQKINPWPKHPKHLCSLLHWTSLSSVPKLSPHLLTFPRIIPWALAFLQYHADTDRGFSTLEKHHFLLLMCLGV